MITSHTLECKKNVFCKAWPFNMLHKSMFKQWRSLSQRFDDTPV